MPEITDLNAAPFGWSRYTNTAMNSPNAIAGFVFTSSSDGQIISSATNTIRQSAYNDGWSYQSNQEATRLNPTNSGWTGWNQPALQGGSNNVPFLVGAAATANDAIPLGQLLGRQKIITANEVYVPTYSGQYLARLISGGAGGGGGAGTAAAGIAAGGGGGRAGNMLDALLTLVGGNSYLMEIGAGGAGGAGGAAGVGGSLGAGGNPTTIYDGATNADPILVTALGQYGVGQPGYTLLGVTTEANNGRPGGGYGGGGENEGLSSLGASGTSVGAGGAGGGGADSAGPATPGGAGGAGASGNIRLSW